MQSLWWWQAICEGFSTFYKIISNMVFIIFYKEHRVCQFISFPSIAKQIAKFFKNCLNCYNANRLNNITQQSLMQETGEAAHQSILSISPTKRNTTTFRSKTKLKDASPSPHVHKQPLTSFKLYLKQFPLGISEEVIKIIEAFEPIHNNFTDNLESLKLYKIQLAALFESNWAEFMEVLKGIVVKLNKRTDRIIEDKENQIAQLLQLNSKNQKQIQRIRQKFDNIEHMRQIEKAELAVANSQVQTVNREMADIYDILRADMGKILKYLTSVEQSKERELKQGSEKIYSSLQNFNTLLSNIEQQHKGTSNTLNTMREMIKAMARNTKSTTATQVDESELQTKAANVFGSSEKGVEGLSYDTLDAGSVNVVDKGNYNHVIDKLKQREKDQTHETYHPKKNVDKPWALTPTLLTFLENMSKQNEAGRVVPWQYMKDLINDIYEERIKCQQEMISGMVGNAMLFDEFVVFFFLKKYRIRRLAEVKLLEFIISIKYYTKFWMKAETFCVLMDVMRFIPMFDQTDMYNYRADYYAQNFFFQVYKVMSSFDMVHEQDGTVYVPIKKVKKLMKGILFFTEEVSRSRLMVKLDKEMRIFDKVEHADFDFALNLFMEEYFAVRRKMTAQISRSFSRVSEKVSGFASIDEILEIFNEFSRTYNSAEQFNQKYPVESQLHIAKLYMYAITSGKNNFELVSHHFVNACQRFGFDSPFPFLHSCAKGKKSDSAKQTPKKLIQKVDKEGAKQQKVEEQKKTEQIPPQVRYINLNQERIDIASKLFSQHFSLLKELKDYVTIFSTTLANQKDPQTLWKSFNQIKLILEKGCAFLKYPLYAKS